MERTPEQFIFYVNEKLKQSRPGKMGVKLSFPKYAKDELICVYSAIDTYLGITRPFRTDNKFFISYLKPHKAVTKETISRWIKLVLGASGLNTDIFQAHSTRAASASAAFDRNLPIDLILQTAGWSNERTFALFYNKEITKSDCVSQFQAAIMK
ncbi:hypothetical protein HOLleu_21590 [Holothuria leucospilota]|uniref:Tyr recombinase domain-containing protein n=1 Tax=Holothuria leucospilota TaxID=206669 RepID=A0A9Q1BXG0_HOLLE|nr:hypothetical protein HOLleu_21590 [Holothuria leucospilota]